MIQATMHSHMEFKNTFRVSFKEQGSKERTTKDIVLKNVHSVFTAKKVLWDAGIVVASIERL